MGPGDKGLGPDELMLLIRSYENMVKPLTEILQLSGQIVMSQKESADCGREIVAQHQKIISDIEAVVKNLSACSNTMSSVATAMDTSFLQNRNDCSKEHASLKSKIHIGWVSSGLVMIALIGLVIRVFTAMGNLDELKLIVPIANALGVPSP